MNEEQLQNLIRSAFRLQAVSERAVRIADETLAQVMAAIRSLVELLPEESLFRNQAWESLEPLVRTELKTYGDTLGAAITTSLEQAGPAMERSAARDLRLARPAIAAALLAAAVGRVHERAKAQVPRSQVNGQALSTLFRFDQPQRVSPVNRALFRNVNDVVIAGVLRDAPTQEIADSIVSLTTRQGIKGVNLNKKGAARKIRAQAQAIARSAVGDYDQWIKESLVADSALQEDISSLMWQHSCLLDSRTCFQCMALDGQRWKQGDKSRPKLLIHVGCRCKQILVDPANELDSKPVEVIRREADGPYKVKGAPQQAIQVKGKEFYSRQVRINVDDPPPKYSDVLGYWAKNSQTSLDQALGKTRAEIFTREMKRPGADPQRVLLSMLRGRPGAQQFIPLKELDLKPKERKT